jgi:hypothetical protein
LILLNTPGASEAEIKHHLRCSFTTGDNRYHAQFWYARALYLERGFDEAIAIFKNLTEANIDIRLKREPRGLYERDGKAVRYSGALNKIEASYGFIKRDGYGDRIFTYRYHKHRCNWEELRAEMRVTFELAFNYRGPVALDLMLESQSEKNQGA